MFAEVQQVFRRIRLRAGGFSGQTDRFEPITGTIEPEVTGYTFEASISIPSAPVLPSPDYADIALRYFSEMVSSSGTPERLLEELIRCSVLRGVDLKNIQRVFAQSRDFSRLPAAVVSLLPDDLHRSAKRTLANWEEYSLIKSRETGMTYAPNRASEGESIQPEPSVQTEPPPIAKQDIGLIYQQRSAGEKPRFRIQELTDDELMGWIRQRSDKIARGDEAMFRSCQAMIGVLRDPNSRASLDLRTLRDARIVIEGLAYPLWRLSPRRSSGLSLPHPAAETLRVVYAIYKDSERKIIALDGAGIYTHSDYEKRYSKPKHKRR